MKVVIAARGWSHPGVSTYAYADSVLGSLTSIGVETRRMVMPDHRGIRMGGLVIPWMEGRFRRYCVEPGVVIHHVEHAVRRGADVATIHDCYPFYDHRMADVFLRSEMRRTMRVTRRLVVTTDFTRREMMRCDPIREDKVRVIPIPFSAPAPGRMEPKYDGLWIGRHAPNKRFDQFVRLAWDFPALRFAVRLSRSPGRSALSGDYLDALRRAEFLQLIESLPYMDRDGLDVTYRSSKVLVVTSDYEGFHIPAMEAYLRGTRLVLPHIEPFVSLYGNAVGVHWYDGSDPDLREVFAKAVGSGPFVPSSSVSDAVSYPIVGAALRAVYEEVARR